MFNWFPDLGLPQNLSPGEGPTQDLAPEDLGAAGYLPLFIGKLRLTFNGPPGLTGLAHRGTGLLGRQSRTPGFDAIFPTPGRAKSSQRKTVVRRSQQKGTGVARGRGLSGRRQHRRGGTGRGWGGRVTRLGDVLNHHAFSNHSGRRLTSGRVGRLGCWAWRAGRAWQGPAGKK
jgi:hypothetical protein